MKKIYLGIILIIIILFFLVPTVSTPVYYSKSKINRLINLSKNNDSNATILLASYYLSNNESDNLKLVVCKMRENKIEFKNKVNYFREKNYYMKECPEKPLSLLENTFLFKYINYLLKMKKLP